VHCSHQIVKAIDEYTRHSTNDKIYFGTGILSVWLQRERHIFHIYRVLSCLKLWQLWQQKTKQTTFLWKSQNCQLGDLSTATDF